MNSWLLIEKSNSNVITSQGTKAKNQVKPVYDKLREILPSGYTLIIEHLEVESEKRAQNKNLKFKISQNS